MSELAYALPIGLGIAPALAFRFLARGRIFEIESAPARPVALVLGAKLHPDGTPTTLLIHRLDAARRLLARGAVERLVLTGLGGAPEADEVGAMRRWLLERGADAGRLTLDASSSRTIESFQWARSQGLSRMAVVTNPFHLPRALFLAQRLGLEAIGVAARPGAPVSPRTMLRNHARESVASLRAIWDVVGAGAR